MPQSNLGICYEGIQRTYRNAVVTFLRNRLTSAFPMASAEKLRAPFTSDEWSRLKQNAQLSRDSGELDTPIRDDFDLLSVNHFFNLFDKYHDELLPIANSEARDRKRQREKLLNWVKMIKDLRDPMSHPTEADFTREDSFMILDCARRVLIRIEEKEPSDRIKDLMDELLKESSIRSQREPLEDGLPPRESIVVDFIGRNLELRELWEWFDDPVSRRWTLAGEGGKGKSALAYNFAFEVKVRAPEPFQAVLWLSAKRKRYLEGRIVEIKKPDFYDLDSALDCLLTHYGWVEELKNPTQSKRSRVLELLDEFPALIVADDVDSIESENEEVLEFFSLHVPETKSKVLFTSRRVIFGMGGTTTHVGGFNVSDAQKFIQSRCRLMELDPSTFDQRSVDSMVKVAEGSPLYIEDLMRLMSMVSPKDALELWVEKGGVEARRYTLGRECELLTQDALKVLLAASICEGAISFAEIEAVLDMASERVTGALQELQRLFLVPKPRLVEGEQRFEVNRNTRALVREVHGRSDLYRRIETTYKTVSRGISPMKRTDVAALVRQAVFLIKANNYREAEQLLHNALQKYHAEPDLFGVLGWVYKQWHPPRLTDAREKFLRASQLGASRPEMYEHWCEMEKRELEWSKGAEAAEKGLKRLKENKRLLYLAGFFRCRLGKELISGLHYEKGGRELEDAKQLLKRALRAPGDDQSPYLNLNSDIYRALVIICEQSNDLSRLKHYFELWNAEYPNDPDAASEWERISRKLRFS